MNSLPTAVEPVKPGNPRPCAAQRLARRLAEARHDVQNSVGQRPPRWPVRPGAAPRAAIARPVSAPRSCRRQAPGQVFQVAMSNGKFHGTTAPTTPSGTRRIRQDRSRVRWGRPRHKACRWPRRTIGRNGPIPARRWWRLSLTSLPMSRLSSSASSGTFSRISSASLSSTALRCRGAMRDQRPSVEGAARAARRPGRYPRAAASATLVRVSRGRVDGVSKVLPEALSTNARR